MSKHDPHLNELVDRLGDTPMQRKIRRLAPLPVGVVFIEWPEMTEEDIRRQFRVIRELGYTGFKQICARPGGLGMARLQHIALDEGLCPWWYGEGGWEDITPELLSKLGLPEDMDIDEAMGHPRMIEHQTRLMRERIDRQAEDRRHGRKIRRGVTNAGGAEGEPSPIPGVVPFILGTALTDEIIPTFVEWLAEQYGSVEALQDAWNVHRMGSSAGTEWKTWEHVEQGVRSVPPREYRHLRDILRFKADNRIKVLRHYADDCRAHDPHEPIRAGGEASLFLPFASRATDMEGFAQVMAEGGSFYPSTHPTWHYEEVEFEFVRPTYIYSSLAADWAKGVWSATWESTGGPQYFSGGKAPFVPEVRDRTPGFTIDAGAMTQMMLSYLAAGYRGFGFWCWNPRDFGWEAGEFALTDRNGEPTLRAVQTGKVGAAAHRLRRELWQARKEPLVGVLYDWDNEAFWAAMSEGGREKYKSDPMRARVGAARALIDANVPWEFVTEKQLRAGLAGRYRSILLPAEIALASDLVALLSEYARDGGRVVMDMPSAQYDEFGRLLKTQPGSGFEQLFGAILHEYWFASNVPFVVESVPLEGFACHLTPTTARVAASYDSGGPAVTENRLGKGSAVLIGAEATSMCFRPGRKDVQSMLVRHVLGDAQPSFACEDAIVYRLASLEADHYFLLNDGPARSVRLTFRQQQYRSLSDPVEQCELPLDDAIELPGWSGRWLRFQK